MQIPLGSTFQKCAPEPEMGAGMHDACMCLGLGPPVSFFSTLTEDTPEPWALDGFRRWGDWWLVFFFKGLLCRFLSEAPSKNVLLSLGWM